MKRLKYWVPLFICLLHLIALIYLGRHHIIGNYATETDFYHFYANDAKRLTNWEFPSNPYQGPGYPAVLALASGLTGTDLFTAGKWLSVACAILTGYLVFLLFSMLFSFRTGVGAHLILILSGEFPQFSINSTTDVFFLFLCLALLVVFTGDRLSLKWRVAASATICSLCYLTRYNGLFLFAACLAGIILIDIFKLRLVDRFKISALFLVVFLVVASPWLYANYRHMGSPFYNTNYLNIATQYYPELVDGETNQDGTRLLEDRFTSFIDVLSYDPGRIVRHYPVNLYDGLRMTVSSTLVNRWVGWAAFAGILMALWFKRTGAVHFLLVSGLIYLLLMALNHWETRYYFYILALYAGFAAFAVEKLMDLLRFKGWLNQASFTAVVCVLCWFSFVESRNDIELFMESEPVELLTVRDYINNSRKDDRRLRIVARKPHLPYLTDSQWIFFPQVGSVEELRVWVEENEFDYLTMSKREVKARKELKPLTKAGKSPNWLRIAWASEDPAFILYEPAVSNTPSRIQP